MSATRSDPGDAWVVSTDSPDQTAALGERIAEQLDAGDVVLLQGELGAGKTCLTQGIARGLGVYDPVCSPTFVLVGEYSGRLRVYHADLYRLDNPLEVADLDLSRLSEDGVLIVEWPERALEWLPHDHLLIKLEHAGPTRRAMQAIAQGPGSQRLLERLAQVSGPIAAIPS